MGKATREPSICKTRDDTQFCTRYINPPNSYRHQLNHSPKMVYKCGIGDCLRTFVRLDLCNRHKEHHTDKSWATSLGVAHAPGPDMSDKAIVAPPSPALTASPAVSPFFSSASTASWMSPPTTAPNSDTLWPPQRPGFLEYLFPSEVSVPAPTPAPNSFEAVMLNQVPDRRDIEIAELQAQLDDKNKIIAELLRAEKSRNDPDPVECGSDHPVLEPPKQSETVEESERTEASPEKDDGEGARCQHLQSPSGAASKNPQRDVENSPTCESPGGTAQEADAWSETETSPRGSTTVKRVGVVTLRVEVVSFSAEAAPPGGSCVDGDDTLSICHSSNGSGHEDGDTVSLVDEETRQGQSSSHSTAQDANAPTQQHPDSSTNISSANPQRATLNQGKDVDKEEDDDGRRRKKRRLSRPLGAPDPLLPSLRLACPYQVYEPWRRCFQQAGGCEDMGRLK